jgi:hypothetical protein
MKRPLSDYRLGRIIKAIIHWWQLPPASERILAAMSDTEWRRSLDIVRASEVCVAQFYSRVFAWEERGIIESKWEDGPIPPERQGHRRRLYRRIPVPTPPIEHIGPRNVRLPEMPK